MKNFGLFAYLVFLFCLGVLVSYIMVNLNLPESVRWAIRGAILLLTFPFYIITCAAYIYIKKNKSS
ncbi:MAG: hypothetical protein ACP5OG_02255 [Candidatus Nanoarchaeia archaeon]